MHSKKRNVQYEDLIIAMVMLATKTSSPLSRSIFCSFFFLVQSLWRFFLQKSILKNMTLRQHYGQPQEEVTEHRHTAVFKNSAQNRLGQARQKGEVM